MYVYVCMYYVCIMYVMYVCVYVCVCMYVRTHASKWDLCGNKNKTR